MRDKGTIILIMICFLMNLCLGCNKQDKGLRIRGVLKVEGSYYSPDVRFYVENKQGERIYIYPWLPLEFMHKPYPDKDERARPLTMLDYLNKEIRAEGEFDESRSLRVKSVVITE